MTSSPATPPVKPAASRARFVGLDGLRAIAVLMVLVFHLGSGVLPGGYLGVDIFFVISGFLITALLLREHAGGGIHLGQFWLRRARRLLPALTLLVLACGAAAWAVGGDTIVGLGRQVFGAVTFSSNWVSLAASQSYFNAATPELLRNLWSLAVEEQFYLLWPLLLLALLLIPKRWLRISLVLAAAVASAAAMALVGQPNGDATRVYYGTDTHSFGLLVGAGLAMALAHGLPAARWLRRTLPVLGALALAALLVASAVMRADAAFPYQGGLALTAVLSGVAIIGATAEGSWLGRGLDAQPMRWIGERSYGLYLWHWPIFVLLLSALPTWSHTAAGGWALGGLALVITVAATEASYRWVEMPIRQYGFRASLAAAWYSAFPRRAAPQHYRRLPRAVAAIGATMLVLASGSATAAGIAGDPGQGSVQVQIEAGARAITESAAPPALAEESLTPAPLPGGNQITAIGDSVMLASARALQEEFPGIVIDAAVSRQFSSAPDLLRAHLDAGTLRPVVLLGLGTNGPVDHESIAKVRQLLGPDHQLVLVNVYAARSWTEGVNTTLTSLAQQYRDVELANWRDAIGAQVRLLAGDQVHPGDEGGRVYAAAVRDALQRLAELPPLLGPRDYGLAAQPI